jgi:hypothetical protein
MAGLTPKDMTDQRNDAMREGVKALVLMNGGGAVALLAFLQAIWSKEPALIKYVLWGVGFLVIGVALTSLVHFFRYHTSLATQQLFAIADQLSNAKSRDETVEGLSLPNLASCVEDYREMKKSVLRYERLYFGCAYLSVVLFVVGVSIILYGAAVEPRTKIPGVEF